MYLQNSPLVVATGIYVQETIMQNLFEMSVFIDFVGTPQ